MTTASIADTRRAFAESLRSSADLRSQALVDAFATVPRERFLGEGPWLVRGPRDAAGPRRTLSADTRLVYEDASIAIDPARDLYNGQPAVVARWLESLDVRRGDRVLHIGCATGYYTAVLAELVGPEGRVRGVEIDAGLAARAREALAPWPQAQVSRGNGLEPPGLDVDVTLVHAGCTHVAGVWLDHAAPGARLLVPLACTIPGMPATLAKGVVVRLDREGDGNDWRASAGGMLMIYAMADARDDEMNRRLGRALLAGTAGSVTRLRRDPHEEADACWLHGPTSCLQ